MAKVYSCFCCDSDVTVPYFFNGAAYGYTCIKRVNPAAKKIKDNGLWIKFDSVEMTQPEPERSRFVPVVTINGKRFVLHAIYANDLTKCTALAVESKLLKIAEHANGAKLLFKGIELQYGNVINQYGDNDGKLTDVLINGESAL